METRPVLQGSQWTVSSIWAQIEYGPDLSLNCLSDVYQSVNKTLQTSVRNEAVHQQHCRLCGANVFLIPRNSAIQLWR